MKKTMIMLAGVLAMPILSLGLVLASPTGAFAIDCGVSGGAKSGIDCAQGKDQATELFGDNGVFTTITNTLLFIIGAIAVLMLIYGGIKYTLSGGDSAAVTAAKNTILYAIVGLIVAIMAYAIINFVLTQFITT